MRVVWLVAAREIRQKLRSKSFWGVNLLLVGLIAVAFVVPVLLDDDGAVRVGVVGADADEVVALAATDEDDGELEAVPFDDEDTAAAAVRDGDVAAALVGRDRLLADGDVSGLRVRLSRAATELSVRDGLAAAGVEPAAAATLLQPVTVAVDQVGDEPEVEFGPEVAIGFAAIGILYGLLVFYGQLVAQGVVQEKQSRVIEVLVSAVRPVELLGGKLLGLGLVGFAQVLLLVGLGGVGVVVSGAVDLPAAAVGTLALVVAWFVLGYLLYATLFALVGALVSRTEDLQSASMPVVVLLVGALLAVQFSFTDPHGTVATVAAVVPFSAPLAQPLRAAAGVGSVGSAVLAVLVSLATVAVLLPLAARVHRGGVLVTRGRIGLRRALASGRTRREPTEE